MASQGPPTIKTSVSSGPRRALSMPPPEKNGRKRLLMDCVMLPLPANSQGKRGNLSSPNSRAPSQSPQTKPVSLSASSRPLLRSQSVSANDNIPATKAKVHRRVSLGDFLSGSSESQTGPTHSPGTGKPDEVKGTQKSSPEKQRQKERKAPVTVSASLPNLVVNAKKATSVRVIQKAPVVSSASLPVLVVNAKQKTSAATEKAPQKEKKASVAISASLKLSNIVANPKHKPSAVTEKSPQKARKKKSQLKSSSPEKVSSCPTEESGPPLKRRRLSKTAPNANETHVAATTTTTANGKACRSGTSVAAALSLAFQHNSTGSLAKGAVITVDAHVEPAPVYDFQLLDVDETLPVPWARIRNPQLGKSDMFVPDTVRQLIDSMQHMWGLECKSRLMLEQRYLAELSKRIELEQAVERLTSENQKLKRKK